MSILSDEQKATLAALIAADANGRGYAAKLQAGMPGHVVDLLNEKTELMHKERLVTNLTLPSHLGTTMARSIRTKLEAFALADIIVADFVQAMKSQPGGNIGDPEAIEMIDFLMTVESGFTAEEGAALKALSLQPASEMEVAGLPFATEEMLRDLK
jgi:hypothetical protein